MNNTIAAQAVRARVIGVAVATLAAFAAPPVFAGGFSLDESSAVEIGNARAGPADPQDASTIVWNPAGMTSLKGFHFTGNLAWINYSPRFTNEGSTSAVGTPATGGDGGNAGGLTTLPSLYLTGDLMPGLTAGVGVYTPFGLKTEYASDWVGRYQAIRSAVSTININPSLAWQATRQLSLGAGVDIMYLDADLTRNIDFGSACFGSPFGPAACTAAGVLPQTEDGGAELKGSSWGVGFNLGALFQPTASTRFGLTYRSKIREDVQGSATFVNPALPGPFAALTATPATRNTNFTATVWLPESATAHFATQLGSKWTLLGNAIWTRWSELNELRARFASGAADSVTTFNWRDVWSFCLAVNYQLNPAWKLRTGYEYEQGTARNDFRRPQVPESVRNVLSIGFDYRATPRDSVDFAYSHIFFSDFSMSSTAVGAGTLSGSYKVSADIFALQYNRTF